MGSTAQRLLFYIAIPGVIAAQNAMRGSMYTPDLPFDRHLLFGLPTTVLSWLFADGVCRVMDRAPLLRRVTRPMARRVAVLLTGGLLTGAVSYYVIGFYLAATGDFFGRLSDVVEPGGYLQKRTLLEAMADPCTLFALFIWVGVNLAFDRLAATQQARGPAAASPSPPPIPTAPGKVAAPPAFLAKLAPDPVRDLIAVEAQEHYIKVHTQGGSELLLYRFKDAVRDLAPYGLQVHRSHWVAKSAITAVDTSPRTLRLTLRNGLQVPVSTAYRGALKLAGVI